MNSAKPILELVVVVDHHWECSPESRGIKWKIAKLHRNSQIMALIALLIGSWHPLITSTVFFLFLGGGFAGRRASGFEPL